MNKKANFFWYLLIFIIGSLIVSAIIDPSLLNSFMNKISSLKPTPTSTDPQINSCLNAYDECRDVITQKYGFSVKLLKYEKFNNLTEANKFYNTWGDIITSNFLSLEYNSSELPIVMLAIKITGPEGSSPTVATCTKEGKLSSIVLNMLC